MAVVKEIVRINFKKGDILTVKLEGDAPDYAKDVIKADFEYFIKSLQLDFNVPVTHLKLGETAVARTKREN